MTDFFNEIAEKYNQTIALINSLDDWVYLKNLPKSRKKFLDIGCGSGHLMVLLEKHFREGYGIDCSQEMVRIAQNKGKNLKISCGDANKLNFPNAYFDLVVSHTTFHHLDQTRAAQEVERILKKGGKFILVDVVLEENKLLKRLKKIFLRFFYSWLKMIFQYGLRKTIDAWRYSEGSVWANHVRSEKEKFFKKSDFKKFYSRFFPGANFGTANYQISYLVWEKPFD